MHQAWDYGAYCALLIDDDGCVVDGDRVTPVVQMKGRLLYPPPRDGAVQSMTICVLADVLAGGGGAQLRLEEGRFTLQDVLEAEGIAVVGSGVGVGRLATVNGSTIGEGVSTSGDVGLYGLLRESLAGAKEAGWEVWHCDK
jgi:branched-subunit amino acid aminotransferase/4-amino-4-deoxychorismate lyase